MNKRPSVHSIGELQLQRISLKPKWKGAGILWQLAALNSLQSHISIYKFIPHINPFALWRMLLWTSDKRDTILQIQWPASDTRACAGSNGLSAPHPMSMSLWKLECSKYLQWWSEKCTAGRSIHKFCLDTYIKCELPLSSKLCRVNFSILPVSMLQSDSHSLLEKEILQKPMEPVLKTFGCFLVAYLSTFSWFLNSCWLESLGRVSERHKMQSTELLIHPSLHLICSWTVSGSLLMYVTAK